MRVLPNVMCARVPDVDVGLVERAVAGPDTIRPSTQLTTHKKTHAQRTHTHPVRINLTDSLTGN